MLFAATVGVRRVADGADRCRLTNGEETVAHLDERRRLEARGLEVHARHDVVLGAGGGDGFERLDV